MDEPTRRCYNCGETKPLGAFNHRRTTSDGFDGECLSCMGSRRRARERGLGYWIKRERNWRKQGIVEVDGTPLTAETFRAVLAFVGNRCELCGVDGSWATLAADHSHQPPFTFRGCACPSCNYHVLSVYERTGRFKSAEHEAKIRAYLAEGGYLRWLRSAVIVLEVEPAAYTPSGGAVP